MKRSLLFHFSRTAIALVIVTTLVATKLPADESLPTGIYAKSNLVAWCIVPFDAAKRDPQARAQMLNDLGIKRVAYDWREDHVATFEQEIQAYQQHGLEFLAFWDVHDDMFRLFEKYKISPQIWKMMPDPAAGTQPEKIEAAARQLMPLVETTRRLGCQLGIYNHGGWAGEPANMVAVCQWLRANAAGNHVGIVYNFHHGHEHIQDFADQMKLMRPYLICLNLNGMNATAEPKILPLGKGQYEQTMMQLVKDSGYRGPIGILDHRGDIDARQSLAENLAGIVEVLRRMNDVDALATY